MARPKTDDGFVMIAIDLFPAILAAGLSGYAQIVLAEVLMQSYGPRKQEAASLWALDLARMTGLEYNNARRAIKELVDAGILAREDETTFRFVKDYESWTPGPGRLESRLGGGLLRWIRGSVARLGLSGKVRRISKRQQSARTVAESPATVYPDCPDSLSRLSPGPAPQSIETVAEPPATVYPDCPPTNIERAYDVRASEDLRIKDSRVIRDAATTSDESSPRDQPPPFPDPDRSPLMAMPGAYRLTDAQAVELWGLVWEAWKSERLCNQFYEHQHWHRAESWRAAIRKCVVDSKAVGSIRYVESIAADYDANGVPEQRPAVARPGRPSPPPSIPLPYVKADPESVHPKHRTEAEHRAVAAKWGVGMDAYFADPRVARFVRRPAAQEQTA